MNLLDGLMYFCGGLNINKELTLWRDTRFVVISLALVVAPQPGEFYHIIKWSRKALKLV